MIDFWLADENWIFCIAAIIVLVLLCIQLLGFGDFGPDFDADIDGDADLGASADGLLALLGLGRLPLVMLLALFFALFAIFGFAGEQFWRSANGSLLTPWIAAPVSGVAALFGTGLLARPLSRILPHDETTAIRIDSLIGRRATILTGHARKDYPARARFDDIHGQRHYVMVEPQFENESFAEGDVVLIVGRQGDVFAAVSTETNRLLRAEP